MIIYYKSFHNFLEIWHIKLSMIRILKKVLKKLEEKY